MLADEKKCEMKNENFSADREFIKVSTCIEERVKERHGLAREVEVDKYDWYTKKRIWDY